MESDKFSIRLATAKDLDQIVATHIDAFPGFFITLLGRSFIKTMYRFFLVRSEVVFLVAESNIGVFCFAVGWFGDRSKQRLLLLIYIPFLCVSVLPALFRNPIAIGTKLWARMRAKDGTPELPKNVLYLSSIGLKRSCWGRGVANDILAAFEAKGRERKASAVILTTDADNNERTLAFYKKCGYKITQLYKQDNLRKMLVMSKHLQTET